MPARRFHPRQFVKVVPDCMYCLENTGEYYCNHCAALVCDTCPCFCCPVCDFVLGYPLPENCPRCNVVVAIANDKMPKEMDQ